MVTDRYTDNRTENSIRLYSCLVYMWFRSHHNDKKKSYILLHADGRAHGFFSFFGRSRFFILFLDPSPLRTFVVLVPVTAHLVPIILNLDAVVYICIYAFLFFLSVHLSLSFSVAIRLFRFRSVCLSFIVYYDGYF